jgi:hypothetical protein
MPAPEHVPQATVYRLSLYHCFLGELLRVGAPPRITSRQLADQLDIKEETVRRDISFVGDIGRPGAGYEPQVLFDALTEFLGQELIAELGAYQMESMHLVDKLVWELPVNWKVVVDGFNENYHAPALHGVGAQDAKDGRESRRRAPPRSVRRGPRAASGRP